MVVFRPFVFGQRSPSGRVDQSSWNVAVTDTLIGDKLPNRPIDARSPSGIIAPIPVPQVDHAYTHQR